MRDNRLNSLEMQQRMKNFAGANAPLIRELYKQQKALTEGTGSEGGYTVPEILSQELLNLAFMNADVRGLFKQVPMNTNLMRFSLVAGRNSVYWVGENTDGTSSDVTFKRVTLEAKKAIVVQEDISTELEEDSIANIWQVMATSMAEALADEFDYQILNGDGTVFTGLIGVPGRARVEKINDDGDKVHPDRILDAEYELAKRKIRGDTIIMGIRTFSEIKKLKDENKQYLFTANTAANPILGTNILGDIWGYDVVVSDQVLENLTIGSNPNADGTNMFLINKKRAGIFGTLRQMTMKSDYNVKSDNYIANMVSRVAFTGYDENAICVIEGITPTGTVIV